MEEIDALPRDNKWNIPEPIDTDNPSKVLSLGQCEGVVVPGLAFDEKCNR